MVVLFSGLARRLELTAARLSLIPGNTFVDMYGKEQEQ